MVELSYQDVCTLYDGVTAIRKGKLVKVLSVNPDNPTTIRYKDIRTQRMYTVLFNQEDFKTPIRRIGFVNYKGNSIFVARVPRRLYKAGLHVTNMEFRNISMMREEDRGLYQMDDLSFYKAYMNIYPTLEEAGDEANANDSVVAFDKQFAIGNKGVIYYKTLSVGTVVNGKIVFNDNHKYLETLLDRNYEKTTRTFAPAPL